MNKILLIISILLAATFSLQAQENYKSISTEDNAKYFAGDDTYKVRKYEEPTSNKKPKNVILMIGDGMGVSHIYAGITSNLGQMYIQNFKKIGFQTTYSATDYTTDSAASGTALATGSKTYNGAIGVNVDTLVIENIREKCEKQGMATGVVATASITHATPAAFVAHQPKRSMYEAIASDFLETNIDVFIGGGYKHFTERKDGKNLVDELKEKGYQVETEMKKIAKTKKGKLAGLIATEHPASVEDGRGDMLIKATETAINILDNDPDGFFLMVEGGKIDWSCHNNDAITTLFETISFSDAVAVAYEFYKKHPNETLIVVTADHETGGMSLGSRSRGYDSDISLLCNQKESYDAFNEKVAQFKNKYNGKPTFKQFIDFLNQEIGLGKEGMELTNGYLSTLKQAFEASQGKLSSTQIDIVNDEYGDYDPLTMAAIKVLNQKAGIGWTSYSHTGSQVPVYAIGVGEELFIGQMDNTDIPKRIAKVMGMEGVLD